MWRVLHDFTDVLIAIEIFSSYLHSQAEPRGGGSATGNSESSVTPISFADDLGGSFVQAQNLTRLSPPPHIKEHAKKEVAGHS